MLQRVRTVQTKFAVKDFIKSLSIAWFRLYGMPPKKSQLAVIYAQWALETGVGTYCWNNNIGNVKATDVPGQVVEYCVLNNVWEIINGKKVILKPEDPGSWFKSFRTLDLGVEEHITFLRNKRYKIAWSAVEAGDPRQFAHLLKQQGYYTAPEADYIRAMGYHYNVFMNGPSFDAVQEELVGFYNGVEFPTEYEPLTFDTKEDIVDRKDKISVFPNLSIKNRILNGIKSFLGK